MDAALRIIGSPLHTRPLEDITRTGDQAGCVDLVDLANIDIERLGRSQVSAEVGRADEQVGELGHRVLGCFGGGAFLGSDVPGHRQPED